MLNRLNRTDKRACKHIIVTGGVVSSLGKGLSAASLGQLLISRGLSVTMQKPVSYTHLRAHET